MKISDDITQLFAQFGGDSTQYQDFSGQELQVAEEPSASATDIATPPPVLALPAPPTTDARPDGPSREDPSRFGTPTSSHAAARHQPEPVALSPDQPAEATRPTADSPSQPPRADVSHSRAPDARRVAPVIEPQHHEPPAPSERLLSDVFRRLLHVDISKTSHPLTRGWRQSGR